MRIGFAWGVWLAIAAIALAGMACGGAAEQAADAPVAATQGGETLRLAMASSDLAVGSNRVVFGVIDPDAGAVRGERVRVSSSTVFPVP